MRVFRVSHSFVAASTRRHAWRKPRRVRVSAAMDPNPNTNTRVGFRRDEMWSESLVGTVKQHDTHAFLVHGDALTWPGKEFESAADKSSDSVVPPAIVMHEALLQASGTYKGGIHKFEKGASAAGNVKLNLAEMPGSQGGVASDQPGDILLFPQMQRHRLGDEAVKDPTEVKKFVKSVVVDGDANEKNKSDISGKAHIFVCTHGKRDARCGVCGPTLVEAFRDAVARDEHLKNKVEVRGCSHVGGHAYAGNVLVFAPGNGVMSDASKILKNTSDVQGTWYGYVTPGEIGEVLQRTVLTGEVVPRLWRGSMGMDPLEHESAAKEAAEKAGEPWPPAKTPCDVCAETDGLADIEDVAGVPSSSVKKHNTAAGVNNVSSKSSGLERTFMATAAIGAVGLVASVVWSFLEE